MENWKHLLSTSYHICTSILKSPVQSRSPSSGSVISHSFWGISVPSSLVTPRHPMTIINYTVKLIIISSLWPDVGTNLSFTVRNLQEFCWRYDGESVSGPSYGKCILEMISDLEMLVHVNLTEFSRGRSVSFEVDVRPIGLQLRVSPRAVLLDRT